MMNKKFLDKDTFINITLNVIMKIYILLDDCAHRQVGNAKSCLFQAVSRETNTTASTKDWAGENHAFFALLP